MTDDKQASEPRVKHISLAEFQRRQHSQHSDYSQAPEPLEPTRAKGLYARIQEQKRLYANSLISQYETLFFSDHVDMRSTPIQSFFPFLDPAASGASPILAAEPPRQVQSFAEWFRDLRRTMFFKVQAKRTKIWDEYDRAYMSRDSTTAPDSSSSASPADSSVSSSASAGSDRPALSFIDSAYPVPSPQQYQRCKVGNGVGVWDTMGVWRCLLGNSSLVTEARSKNQLFTNFEDYMNWKVTRRANSPLLDLPEPQFLLKTLFDSGAIPPFQPTSDLERDPNAPKRAVGHSTVWSSVVDETGKRSSVKKTQTIYDDGTVSETVDEKNSEDPMFPDPKAWIESRDWSNETEYIRRASDILGSATESLAKTGAETIEKSRKLIEQYLSQDDNKIKSFIDKFWSSSGDDDEKRKK